MELCIRIDTTESCSVTVQDLMCDYLPEDSTVTIKNKWKFSETAAVTILQLNKSTDSVILNPVYSSHKNNDPIIIPIKFDGWFTVVHIVLPTREWIETEMAKGLGSALYLYDVVYFFDKNQIYKIVRTSSGSGGSYGPGFDDSWEQNTTTNFELEGVTLEEVIYRNVEGTTISRVCEDYVSICFLNRCYIDLAQQIFRAAGFNACDKKNQIDPDLIFRRDLVWMTINVIKYMTDLGQLAEAQRIIERIAGCNGLCRDQFNKMPDHECGCGGSTFY